MDPAIPQLGPGPQPADSPLWGPADTISVNWKAWGRALWKGATVPSLIPSASIALPGNPNLIPEAGCGQSPQSLVNAGFLGILMDIDPWQKKSQRHKIIYTLFCDFDSVFKHIG